jgi:hypothetical protein
VAGELPGDGDRDDGAALAAPLERVPACVETAGASVGAGTDGGWLALASALQRRARSQRSPLLPGRFDEQAAGMGVTGLGDRAEAAALAA